MMARRYQALDGGEGDFLQHHSSDCGTGKTLDFEIVKGFYSQAVITLSRREVELLQANLRTWLDLTAIPEDQRHND
jgi:hypothetical protein